MAALTLSEKSALAENPLFWLANYNTETPDLIQSGSPELIGQPTDNELLNALATDVVFDTVCKIDEGDDLLPINTTL